MHVAVPALTVQQRTLNPEIAIPKYLRITWRRPNRPIFYLAVLRADPADGRDDPNLALASTVLGGTATLGVHAARSRRIWFELYLYWANRAVLVSLLATAVGGALLGLNAGGVEAFSGKNVNTAGALLLIVGAIASLITALRAER
jgi:hypothetical protein